MKKDKIWKLTGIFFGGMLLFTLLSRAAYQHGTAVVSTKAPAAGTIAHTVQITGKTLQNQEQAVATEAGLRIASVRVNEGQQVAKDEVLFTLDLTYLEETILTQKQEMEKQRLSVQDAWSQNAANQKRQANARASAEESYNSAVSQAGTRLERAARDLERAEEALDAFYHGASPDPAEEEALLSACQEAKDNYNGAVAALEQLKQEVEAAVQQAVDQALAESPETPPSQEELDTLAQTVRDGYASQLSEAEARILQAEQAVTQTEADLAAWRQEQATAPSHSEQELLDAVEQAQEAYEDALAALDNAETTYGRAIAAANLPDGSNHSAQIGQITYDQMELVLSKLEALLEAGGEIRSPVDGIVTKCNVQTGEKTTDSTAMLLADMSQGCKFSGTVTEKQSKYIGVGDKVTLRAESTGKRYEDLPVTTLTSGEEEGIYNLTVQLPANTLTLGARAELRFTRKSQAYPCCVPLSALHLDARNQPYVLVAEEVDTVLGTQWQARKVEVTVLDQNETTAALEAGVIHSEQKVIVGSDRAVDSGSRVRVE